MEENKLIKYEGGIVKKISNTIAISNKLISEINSINSLKYYENGLSFYKIITLRKPNTVS